MHPREDSTQGELDQGAKTRPRENSTQGELDQGRRRKAQGEKKSQMSCRVQSSTKGKSWGDFFVIPLD
jgi:hypothetical protein